MDLPMKRPIIKVLALLGLLPTAVRLLHRLPAYAQKPSEMPRDIMRCVSCVWHVKIRRRTLVLLERPGGIGDLVCLLGSVPGLRNRHPDSWMVIISPPGTWQLTASSGLCDAASDAGSFFHWFIKIRFLRAIVYRPVLPDEFKPAKPRLLHLSDEFARALGVEANLLSVRFRVPAPIRSRMVNQLRAVNRTGPVIVMHVGPTWSVKEWPAQRWIELGEKIFAASLGSIIQIGTDFDSYGRTAGPTVRIPNATNWVDKLPLIHLVALLEQAHAFVGIDSGPLHIAMAVGTPCVGLFGPTRGSLFVHPRANIRLLNSSQKCLGCHHADTGPIHWEAGCPNNIACMRGIHSEEVLNALHDLLER
jgi:ADP-heptose:LPS heptosyltransferase